MGVRPHVVIVGAGFGGLAVARGLDKLPVEVTLVDRENFTTFQPLLYQVATSGLNAADVAHPIRGLFHHQRNLHVQRGDVVGVDWDAGVVHLADERDLPFDHLVLAVGAVATWFGVPGAEQHATPLYTLEDAVRVRNHVLERFESADAEPDLIDAGELNFVIVGGGPTGVETAGALAELFSVVFKRDYPALGVGRARVVLVETRDALLGPFHASSRRAALDTLRARQVEVRLDETIAEVTADHVRFASGEVLPTRTVIWAAGVTANPLPAVLGLPTTRGGRVAVAPDLRVEGHDDVWALGDVAAALAHRGDGVLPQLAPVAMQSGAHVARQIGRVLEGKPTQRFRFRDKGMMATIGRRSAVAELPGRIRLRGTLAWFAWLGLHLLYLAGLRNRLSVLLNWAWAYLTWDRGPRIIFGDRRPRTAVLPDSCPDGARPHRERTRAAR
jgi:NADH:ubiquinone reductase (H+-translocating)